MEENYYNRKLQRISELSTNEVVNNAQNVIAELNGLLKDNPDNYDEIQGLKDKIFGDIAIKAIQKQRLRFWMVLAAIAIVGGFDFLLYYLVQLEKDGLIQLPYFFQDFTFFVAVLGFVPGIPIIIGLLMWSLALRECNKYIPGFSKEYVPFYRLIRGATLLICGFFVLLGVGYLVQSAGVDKMLYKVGFSEKAVMSGISFICQILFIVIIGAIFTNMDKIRKKLWARKNLPKR